MKKILFLILLCACFSNAFSQVDSANLLRKINYLQKSKNQRTAGWVLAGGATALFTVASIIGVSHLSNSWDNYPYTNSYNTTTEDVLSAISVAAALGSIPLFISAHRNKKRAKLLSVQVKIIPQISLNKMFAARVTVNF